MIMFHSQNMKRIQEYKGGQEKHGKTNSLTDGQRQKQINETKKKGNEMKNRKTYDETREERVRT